MKKVIKARLYIKRTFKNEEQGKRICDRIDKDIKDYPIDYACYEAEFNEKTVVAFDITIRSDSYKACEMFYQYMKTAIKDHTYAVPRVVAKIKCEEIE